MKKVLFVTYYWPPSGGAGVQRSLKFVRYLREFGVEPIVLTVDPVKATYPVTDESLHAEVPRDIRVVRTDSFEPLKIMSVITGGKARIPHGGFTNQNKEKFSQKVLRFIRGNFFLPDARKGWVRFAVKAADELIRKERIDTVVISTPPHSSQLIGMELKKKHADLTWIADLRDPWTDIYYYNEMMHTAIARRRDLELEKQVLESCDAAITVSNELKRLFLLKSPLLEESKFHVIPNGYDTSDFSDPVEPSSKEFVITYVGTIADSYEPDVFFRVLRSVLQADPGLPLKMRFVGSISNAVNEWCVQDWLKSRVEFIRYVPHHEAVRFMKSSVLLLLLIPRVRHDKGILTGKLFEYIGAARPVVGIGPEDGDAALILKECQSGKMFARERESELTEYLISLVSKWKRGESLLPSNDVRVNYSRRSLTEQLSRVIFSA